MWGNAGTPWTRDRAPRRPEPTSDRLTAREAGYAVRRDCASYRSKPPDDDVPPAFAPASRLDRSDVVARRLPRAHVFREPGHAPAHCCLAHRRRPPRVSELAAAAERRAARRMIFRFGGCACLEGSGAGRRWGPEMSGHVRRGWPPSAATGGTAAFPSSGLPAVSHADAGPEVQSRLDLPRGAVPARATGEWRRATLTAWQRSTTSRTGWSDRPSR